MIDHLAVLPPQIEVWSVLVGKSAIAFPRVARELPVTLLAPLYHFLVAFLGGWLTAIE